MSGCVERCPRDASQLVARTNGMGAAYLECWCGYVEAVTRRQDPFPSLVVRTVDEFGHTRIRRVSGSRPYRQGMQKGKVL